MCVLCFYSSVWLPFVIDDWSSNVIWLCVNPVDLVCPFVSLVARPEGLGLTCGANSGPTA